MIDVIELTKQLIETIVSYDKNRLEEDKLNLIYENHSLGNPHFGFLFSGNFYSCLVTSQARKIADKQPLHSSLMERGSQMHMAFQDLDKNSKIIQQGLSLVLAPCMTTQDARDALPDYLVKDTPDSIKNLSRTRPVAWTLEGYPMRQHTFKVTEDLIMFFYANRMLY